VSKKFTHEEVEKFIENLGYELTSEYINSKEKLTLRDKNTGYLYFSNLNNLKNGKIPDAFHKSNPYTIQNIKLWCKLNNKPFELVSNTYEGNNKNLKWQCLKEECKEIFEMNWGNISQGKGCGFCCGRQVGISNCVATKFPDLILEWHPILNGDLSPYNLTCGSNEDILWICKYNPKHMWQAKIYNRTNGNTGCPYCSHNLPSEDYNLLLINPDLCKEWNHEKNIKNPDEYTPNSGERVWWTCKEEGCNHEWFSKITHRNDGSGCPECLNGWGEKQLKVVLDKYNINSMQQFRFEDCRDKYTLPFDVATFADEEKIQLRIIIEYDGEQHFKPVNFGGVSQKIVEEKFAKTKYHDLIKNNYCIRNNIPLLRIPYWERLNIEEILVDVLVNGNMNHKYFVR